MRGGSSVKTAVFHLLVVEEPSNSENQNVRVVSLDAWHEM